MMTQNNIPATAGKKRRKSIIMLLFFSLCLLLVFFFIVSRFDQDKINHTARMFQAYMQFTDPDYGLQPSDLGYNSSASISTTSSFLSMEIVVSTGLKSASANLSVFSDKIKFKEGNPKQTFDRVGVFDLHPYDASIIETLETNTDATLDVTFFETYPLDEIRTLGTKYNCFISWIASPGRGIEEFGFPGTNEIAIRGLIYNAASYQDHLAYHQEFKESVREALIQGIFVYGIRVSGTSQDLLNLLDDRSVQSVVVIKLNGQSVVE